ncbi:MAG TPA: isoprenylcysteine carboxylmethyltransferase family protein [Stenotrophomonas sp.]
MLALCGGIAWWLPASWRMGSPIGFQIAGIAVAVLGLALNLLPKLAFGQRGTTVNPLHPERSTQLVSGGLYRRSRNPMYVGQALLLLGWGLWLAQPLALACLAAYVAWIDRLQIPAEEQALQARFGNAYIAYCRRVRRWL